MKRSKKLARKLAARLKWYDNLPKNVVNAFTRPGSQKK